MHILRAGVLPVACSRTTSCCAARLTAVFTACLCAWRRHHPELRAGGRRCRSRSDVQPMRVGAGCGCRRCNVMYGDGRRVRGAGVERLGVERDVDLDRLVARVEVVHLEERRRVRPGSPARAACRCRRRRAAGARRRRSARRVGPRRDVLRLAPPTPQSLAETVPSGIESFVGREQDHVVAAGRHDRLTTCFTPSSSVFGVWK